MMGYIKQQPLSREEFNRRIERAIQERIAKKLNVPPMDTSILEFGHPRHMNGLTTLMPKYTKGKAETKPFNVDSQPGFLAWLFGKEVK